MKHTLEPSYAPAPEKAFSNEFHSGGAILVAPNTTFCPDTPQNWQRFNYLKNQLDQGNRSPKKIIKTASTRPILLFGYNTVSR